MLQHLLDPAQRRLLCQAAQLLTGADGVLDLREEELLRRLRAACGAPELPAPPADLDALLARLEPAFPELPARRALLFELMRFVVADGAIDEDELDVIAAICRRLDLSRDVYRRCRDLARRLAALEQDALDLVADDEPPPA